MVLLLALAASLAPPGGAEAVAKKGGSKGLAAKMPGAGARSAPGRQRAQRIRLAKLKAVKKNGVRQKAVKPVRQKAVTQAPARPEGPRPKPGRRKPAKSAPQARPAASPAPAAAASPSAAAAAPPAPGAAAPGSRPARRSSARRPRAARRAATRRVTDRTPSSAVLAPAASLVRGGALPLAVSALAVPRGGEAQDRDRDAAPSGGERRREGGSPVTRTVRDIVEVVPEALKLAIAALIALSAVLAGGYLLTSARARRLARQRAELLGEVGLLQTALLPPVPATVGAMRTSVAYRPSDGPGAGGDFYDALTLPGGRAAFILGDVSGHGRQALAQTAFIRYTLRAYLEAGMEPRLALQLASPVIGEHLGGDFATVVLAVHDPGSGSLTYACAGHPAPIVVGPSRPEPILAASSLPIGLAMRTGVRQTTLPLPPGSVVCLYTDGLAEARTQSGILGRPRLADILEELGRDATAPALLDRVAREARLVTDDMATVLLSPTAGVTAGGFREERLEVDLDELESGLGGRFLEACGLEGPQLVDAVAEARGWAGSHGAAVLHVRFGIRGPMAEALPSNVESLEAASRRRALA